MESPDPHAAEPVATVLQYAPARPAGSLSREFPLVTATLVCTSFGLWFAFRFVSIYVDRIGSTCGTPVATAESAIWLFAGAALLESVVARSFARKDRHLATSVRTLSLCVLANIICLLTPTFLDLRAEYWPH